ncbi:MAG: hypothetical protein IPH00_10475 [Flavobacteriales bacterium]|nr:hypothetical protein [Flavobacteriales bacterium]
MTVTVITITDPATAGNDTAACINSGVLQLSGAPSGGTWSGSHVDAAGAFDPAVVGTYTLTYSVGNGSCVTQDQVDVTVDPLPVIAITSVVAICADGAPEDFAATPVGGSWSGTGITGRGGGHFRPGSKRRRRVPGDLCLHRCQRMQQQRLGERHSGSPSHGGLLQRPHRMLWFVFSIFG